MRRWLADHGIVQDEADPMAPVDGSVASSTAGRRMRRHQNGAARSEVGGDTTHVAVRVPQWAAGLHRCGPGTSDDGVTGLTTDDGN